MAEPGVVRITYSVDTTEVNTKIPRATAQLDEMGDAATASGQAADKAAASVGDMGDAAAKATPQVKGVAAAADAAAKGTKAAGDAAADSKSKLEKAADAGKKLRGALDSIIPGAGAVVGALDDAADASEGLGMAVKAFGGTIAKSAISLGAVGIAVGVAYGAYKIYNAELERNNALKKVSIAENAAMLPIERQLADAITAADVATGRLNTTQAEELRIRTDAHRQMMDSITSYKRQREELDAQIASTKNYLNLQRGLAVVTAGLGSVTFNLQRTLLKMKNEGKSLKDVVLEDAQAVNAAFDAFTGLETGADVARASLASVGRQQTETTAAIEKGMKANLEAAAATRARAADEKETAEWLAQVNAQMAEQAAISAANSQRFYATLGNLEAMQQAALDATRARTEGETAAIDRQRNEQVAAAKAAYEREFQLLDGSLSAQETLRQAYHNTVAAIDADAEDAKAAIFAETEAAKTAATEAETEKRRKIQMEQAAYEKESAAESLQIRRDFTSASLDLAKGYAETFGEGLAFIAEQAGASEAEVFRIRKAAAIASAGILTAQGVLTALQTPPPLTALAVGLAAATGALQLANIAASQPPSFRLGGIIGADGGSGGGMLPDARLVSMELGEGALTRQGVAAAGGEDGVEAMNAGQGAGDTIVDLRLGHRTMQEVIVRQFNQPGPVRSLTRPSSRGTFNPYPLRGSR